MKKEKVKNKIDKKVDIKWLDNGSVYLSTISDKWFAEKTPDGQYLLKHVHSRKNGKSGRTIQSMNHKLGQYHVHKKYKNFKDVEKYVKFHDYRPLTREVKSNFGKFVRGENINNITPEWRIY